MTRPGAAWADQLQSVLREANIAIEATPVDVERQKVLSKFLQDLTDVCRLMPVPERDLGALKDLTKAFYDLSRGVQHPLLKVSRKAGRELSSGDEQRIRARGIALVELFKEAGLAAGVAEMTVAEELNRTGIVGHNGKRLSKDTIHKWAESAHPLGSRPLERMLADKLVSVVRREAGERLIDGTYIKSRIPELMKEFTRKVTNPPI